MQVRPPLDRALRRGGPVLDRHVHVIGTPLGAPHRPGADREHDAAERRQRVHDGHGVGVMHARDERVVRRLPPRLQGLHILGV